MILIKNKETLCQPYMVSIFIMTNSKMLTIRRLFIGKFLTSGARVGKIEVEKQ